MKRFLLSLLLALLPLCAGASTTEVYATNVDAGGTDLRWEKFPPASGSSWPACLVIHVGGYSSGNRGPISVSNDMAAAGFLTFAIEYRLAQPAGAMVNAGPPGDPQTLAASNGQPPQQTDDVALAVAAARAYPGCNGKVVIVGGSSGAGHAAFVATLAAGNSRPDVVVCLSGIYDLADVTSLAENSSTGRNPTYSGNLENYIGISPYTAPSYAAAAQAASPYWQSGLATTPVPFLLVSADADTIPTAQYNRMKAALIAASRDGEYIFRVTGSTNADSAEHAFQAWNKTTGLGGTYPNVKDYVIDFLFRKMSATAPPVEAVASILVQRK